MATVTIPTNYSMDHMHLYSSRGPSMKVVLHQLAADLAALNVRQAAIRTAFDALITKYNLHLAAAGTHIAADVDNLVASAAATDPTADILTLVNACYTQYEAHRVNISGGIHGAADTTNIVTATAPATTEAEAIALMNDVKAQYEAHRILTAGSVHAGADATNTIASSDATDWDSLVTLANEFKNTTGFNAHIAVTPAVHGADGSADAIAAANAGTQITALQTELGEIKTDVNAHIAHLGVHPTAGVANATAAATDEATAVALCNGLKASLNTHIASADDHLDADGTTTPVAGTASEYEDIIAVVVELRAAYNAHRILGPAIHPTADSTNTGSAIGAGGDVSIGIVAGSADT